MLAQTMSGQEPYHGCPEQNITIHLHRRRQPPRPLESECRLTDAQWNLIQSCWGEFNQLESRLTVTEVVARLLALQMTEIRSQTLVPVEEFGVGL